MEQNHSINESHYADVRIALRQIYGGNGSLLRHGRKETSNIDVRGHGWTDVAE